MSPTDTNPFSETQVLVIGPFLSNRVDCHFAHQPTKGPPRDYVENTWSTYKTQNKSVFDGPMIGLAEITERTATSMHLLVKRTSYAEYIATRDPLFERTHAGFARANPLGLTAIVVSSDNKVIITRRSLTADQNPGMAYFLGGYLEQPTRGDLRGLISKNTRRELREEQGLTVGRTIVVMGIAEDPVFRHPEIFVIARTSAHSTDIPGMWRQARDREETSRIRLEPVWNLLTHENHPIKESTTWSFAAATWLLKRCWEEAAPMLGITARRLE